MFVHLRVKRIQFVIPSGDPYFSLGTRLRTDTAEYRHQYLNRQHISKRKNSCLIVYATASPAEPPSETSGLRVSVQLAKPASHIRLL